MPNIPFKTRGFTLIELLVVIAIIGILSGIVIPRVQLARESSQIAAAQAQVLQLKNAIVLLGGDTTEWPGHQPADVVDNGGSGNEVWDLSSSSSGLVATDGTFANWKGPYMPQIITDPWGNNYFFDTDYDIGTSSSVWTSVVGSFGPNGDGQNVYDSDNIVQVLTTE